MTRFGLIVTTALAAMGVGYPGLLLVTLFFVWRFLNSLEARERIGGGHALAAVQPVKVAI